MSGLIKKSDCFNGFVPQPVDRTRAGTYRFVQEGTDATYIGSTVNCYRRYIAHTSALCRGEHGNRNLQEAFNAHPRFSFSFEDVSPGNSVGETIQKVREKEQEELDSFPNKANLLNIAQDTKSAAKGLEVSEETRRKISEKMAGRSVSLETRRRRSLTMIGKPHSAERRENLSKARSKNPVTVDNVEYRCAHEAARKLGVKNKNTILFRCKSSHEKYSNYQFGNAVV